jgi:hypothetical protein
MPVPIRVLWGRSIQAEDRRSRGRMRRWRIHRRRREEPTPTRLGAAVWAICMGRHTTISNSLGTGTRLLSARHNSRENQEQKGPLHSSHSRLLSDARRRAAKRAVWKIVFVPKQELATLLVLLPKSEFVFVGAGERILGQPRYRLARHGPSQRY